MTIRVLLADDHAVVREGLRALLESQADVAVIGVAEDGLAAVSAAKQLQPDVIVMDISMPGISGIEACRRICERQPGANVLVLSMHGSSEHVYRAMQAGARGFVLKESAAAEVVTALHALQAGRKYLGEKIRNTTAIGRSAQRSDRGPLDRLSAREREILRMVVRGCTSAQVAGTLSLSIKTVETYRSRLMQKLGVHGVAELVKFAIDHGLSQ